MLNMFLWHTLIRLLLAPFQMPSTLIRFIEITLTDSLNPITLERTSLPTASATRYSFQSTFVN